MLTYEFQQTGGWVTGYYYINNDEKYKAQFQGATVSGNTMRFQIANSPQLAGQFVMAEDGKSFTGNIGKSPVTAILVKR